jgi:hypothetical protein
MHGAQFSSLVSNNAADRWPCGPHLHRNLGAPLPHLCRDWAHPCHICALLLGAPVPHLHRDSAHLSHICSGGLGAATSAPGLGPPLPHRHRDWAHPSHIGTGIRVKGFTKSRRSITRPLGVRAWHRDTSGCIAAGATEPSRRRCGGGEPSPGAGVGPVCLGADATRVSSLPVQMWHGWASLGAAVAGTLRQMAGTRETKDGAESQQERAAEPSITG